MPLSTANPLSPSIFGAILRFRRVVILSVVVVALIALIFTALAEPVYQGKAGIVISSPPSSLQPFFGSGTSRGVASYTAQQVSLLGSQQVSNGAAIIVNNTIDGTHVTGAEIHSNLVVKPQTGGAAGLNPATSVIVSMGSAELAAASANAVVQSYLNATHVQIRKQASQSLAAIDAKITATNNELAGLPAPTVTTPTTVPKTPTVHIHTTVPHTTVPHTTTTHAPKTTTTHAPKTTTTTSSTSTTTTTSPTTSSSASAKAGPPSNLVASHSGGSTSIRLVAVVITPPVSLGSTTTTLTSGSTATTTPTTAAGSGSSTSSSTGSANNAQTAAKRAQLINSLLLLNRAKTQVGVDQQADLAYAMVTYPATIPTSSANGNFARNVGIGIALGLLLGVIAAYMLAMRRQQFEKPEEPELFYKRPLLEVVPAFRSPNWLPQGLPMLTEPQDEPAEAIRTIATTLRAIRKNDEPLLVGMSAASPRSGTTTMVANTGLALAEMGERILVVDGDPVGRGLTRLLTETDQFQPIAIQRPGFSEVVGGRPLVDTVVEADAVPELSVLTSGMDPDFALTRWSQQSLQLALNDITANYDIVIIDIPPIGASYGTDLASAVGNLVLVVPFLDPVRNHDGVPDRITFANINMLGYIFNGTLEGRNFVPYYPMLHTADAGQEAAPIASSVPVLVSAGVVTSMDSPAPPAPPPPPTPPPQANVSVRSEDDVTSVVPAVRTRPEAPTGQVPPVSGAPSSETGRTPVVDDDLPTES